MKNHDLVEQAMNLLRTEGDAIGPTLNPQLEKMLMDKYSTQTTTARPMRAKTLVIALGLLAVSGVTFAATGGIERIKSWFVTVDVDGQQVHLLVGENQEGTIITERDDGTKTEVTVNKGTTKDGGDRTRVSVIKTSDDGQRKEVQEIVRHVGNPATMENEYTIEDLGGTTPAKSWQDADGLTQELYLVPTAEGENTQLFLVRAAGTDEMIIRKIGEPRGDWLAEDVTTDVTIDDEGTLTIKATTADGNEQVIKLRIRSSQNALPDGEMMEGKDIRIKSPNGDVKIKIEENDDSQNP